MHHHPSPPGVSPWLPPALLAVLCLAAAFPGRRAEGAADQPPANLVLENAACRVEVDRRHGRLLRLEDKQGGIDLTSPLELAENFRLLVSLPDDPRNCVYGKDQILSRTESSSDALVLFWDGPMKDQRGTAHDLAVTMRIQLEGEAVVFRLKLANRTPTGFRKHGTRPSADSWALDRPAPRPMPTSIRRPTAGSDSAGPSASTWRPIPRKTWDSSTSKTPT